MSISKLVILLYILIFVSAEQIPIVKVNHNVIKIGVFMEKSSIEGRTVRETIDFINKNKIYPLQNATLTPVFQAIDKDSPYVVSRQVCQFIENGIVAIIGSLRNPQSMAIAESIFYHYTIPHIAITSVLHSKYIGSESYSFHLKPSKLAELEKIFTILEIHEYRRIGVLYDQTCDSGELVSVLQLAHRREVNVQLEEMSDWNYTTKSIAISIKINRINRADIRVAYLCVDRSLIDDIVTHVVRQDMHTFKHTWIIKDEVFQDAEDDFASLKRLYSIGYSPDTKMEQKWKNVEQAISYDAVHIIAKAISSTIQLNQFRQQKINCNRHPLIPLTSGHAIMGQVKKLYFSGATGKIEFNDRGERLHWNPNIHDVHSRMKQSSISKREKRSVLAASESNDNGESSNPLSPQNLQFMANETLRITTVIDAPFIMYKPENQRGPGIDAFEGYCIDLLKLLVAELGFNFTISLEPSNIFGELLEDGNWDGMVGQLARREMDIAVAPLSITSFRQSVIDFTKPFMQSGLQLLISKPNRNADFFAFLRPFSPLVWILIALALIFVGVVMYLLDQYSPVDLDYGNCFPGLRSRFGSSKKKTRLKKVLPRNALPRVKFNLANSFWFAIGSYLQQGVEAYPRSISGRLLATFYWFFVMVMVASYTANMAAFLTTSNLAVPVSSVQDLTKQSAIDYGTVIDSEAMDFLKSSTETVYRNAWSHILENSKTSLLNSSLVGINKVRRSKGKYAFIWYYPELEYAALRKPCDVMVVGSKFDLRGFGIGLQKNSPYRDVFTLAALKLQERGETEKLRAKWWDQQTQCPPSTSSAADAVELGVNNVAGIFMVLGGALMLATILLIIELFMFKFCVSRASSKRTMRQRNGNLINAEMGENKLEFTSRKVSSGNINALDIPRATTTVPASTVHDNQGYISNEIQTEDNQHTQIDQRSPTQADSPSTQTDTTNSDTQNHGNALFE